MFQLNNIVSVVSVSNVVIFNCLIHSFSDIAGSACAISQQARFDLRSFLALCHDDRDVSPIAIIASLDLRV